MRTDQSDGGVCSFKCLVPASGLHIGERKRALCGGVSRREKHLTTGFGHLGKQQIADMTVFRLRLPIAPSAEHSVKRCACGQQEYDESRDEPTGSALSAAGKMPVADEHSGCEERCAGHQSGEFNHPSSLIVKEPLSP